MPIVPGSRAGSRQAEPRDVGPLQHRVRRRLGRALSGATALACSSVAPLTRQTRWYLVCRVLHAHVILNPAAGRGAARRVESTVARAFRAQGWAVDVARTEGPGHGQELAAAAARDGAKHIVAVGGDGTVHEVANGLLRSDSDAALGVIPAGSGNDFAKLIGVYGHDPARAV